MKCTLLLDVDSANSNPLEFDKEEITIGRHKENDIVLDDMSVSRYHAKIVEKEGKFELIDLESRNGIRLNGIQVKTSVLSDRDKIEIGDVPLEFFCEEISDIHAANHGETVLSGDRTILFSELGDDKKIRKLIITSGEEAGSEYLLNNGISTIGRSEENEIVINDSLVSRRHAQIVLNDDTVTIKDLGSGNGTFVSGKKISESMLSSGDDIKIGKVTLRYVARKEDSSFIDREVEKEKNIPVANKIPWEKVKRPLLYSVSFIAIVIVVLLLIPGKKGEKDVQQKPVKDVISSKDIQRKTSLVQRQVKLHITDGKKMLDNLQYGGAVKKFQSALKLDAGNKEAIWLLEAAYKHLEKSSRPEAETKISYAVDAYIDGRTHESLHILKKINKAPLNKKQAESARAYIGYIQEAKKSFWYGAGLYSDKNIEGALEEWKKTLLFEKELPLTAKSWYSDKIAGVAADELYRKGLDSSVAGDQATAVRSWKKALDIFPDHKDSLSRLEDIARNIYDEGDALKDTDRKAAVRKWKEVLTIVPPGSRYYVKAKAKLKKD